MLELGFKPEAFSLVDDDVTLSQVAGQHHYLFFLLTVMGNIQLLRCTTNKPLVKACPKSICPGILLLEWEFSPIYFSLTSIVMKVLKRIPCREGSFYEPNIVPRTQLEGFF